MKKNRLLKIYIFLFTLFFGVGIYLAFNLLFGLNNVKADSTVGKFWGDRPWAVSDANCRREGNSCNSRAEFREYGSGDVSVGRMLYCRGNLGTQDGLIYGRWEADDINICYPNNNFCDNRSGFISNGDGPSCGNPYTCPTPEPTYKIRVEAICRENGQQLRQFFEVSRDNPNAYYKSGWTSGEVDGILAGNQYQVRIRREGETNFDNNGWPNLRLDDSQYQSAWNGQTVKFYFRGCTPDTTPTLSQTTTPTPTPTSTPTPTPSPTPTPPVAQCINAYIDGNTTTKRRALNPGESATITMVVENPSDRTGTGALMAYNNHNRSNNIPLPANIPVRNVTNMSTMFGENNTGFRGLNAPVISGNRATYTWRISYDQINQRDSNFNNTLLTDVQLNGFAGGTTNSHINCVVSLFTTRTPQQVNPDVRISKTLTSVAQPVQGQVRFNIDVQNIGSIDLRDFTVTDDFDPSYLQFVSATYNGQTLTPTQGTGQNGRTTLTWSNLPVGNGVLRVGQTYSINLVFRSLRDSRPSSTFENDNCAVVNQITYTDGSGQTQVRTINNQRSCAEFTTTTQLSVAVTKRTLTPTVSVGQEVRFAATISNNTQDRTYGDIHFIDTYDTTYLRPLRVRVTAPNGTVRTYCPAAGTGCDALFATTNPIRINGIHTVGGSLTPGQSYQFEIAFQAIAPVRSTCDTVQTDIVDNNGNPISGSSPQACAEITAPPPPRTGASFLLNFITPGVIFLTTAGSRAYLKYKMIA